ncbi:hypothetical protein Hena1_01730 [Erwinia phage Hena1]|uniref:Uncharacterized protein n=1 Tax=Erwinia phage Hena1 TaxID=2678601 RepID=A0A6B9J9S6_9CAUD|nr:hypothetical protein HWC84_gp191 [Erwinia phage Hena1]QGZ16323.1 hypothetical protein Hena1_01730 [Erwinia phage Hena1]
MLKWLAKILGLVKEEKYILTQEKADKIVTEAAQRVAEKRRQDSAMVQAVDQMVQEQRGFTTPDRAAAPGPAKFNTRGVRVPTPEESRRARPVTPPPPPPPVRRSSSPSRSSSNSRRDDSSSDVGFWAATSAASWGGDSGSSSSSSCDSGGGGGSCD